MPAFVPALELNAAFYGEMVASIVEPWPHSAGLLGRGSDVLGFDTERSTDHDWGPRLQVFVDDRNVDEARRAIDENLPSRFRDRPVRYGWDSTSVQHHVRVVTLSDWLGSHLGVDPGDDMTFLDWLVTPQQQLLGVVRGAVYADGLGQLHRMRNQLNWFPDDLWLWMLACQWRRIAQEEAFVGRTAEVGDELGSRLVAARLVRELMRLCFLLAREYWPYTKWFGSAFARLPHPRNLDAAFTVVLDARDYRTRERALVEAYQLVALHHNDTCITEAVEPTVRRYHSREFLVLMSDRFVDACLARVSDPWLRSLPLLGSIDQVADSTDLLSYPDRAVRLRALYSHP